MTFDPVGGVALTCLTLVRSDVSGSITASSGAVSAWADQSGNGRDFTQADAGLKPTTGTQTSPRGVNVLDFIDDFMDSTDFVRGEPFTICVVAKFDVADNSGIITSDQSSGAARLGQSSTGTGTYVLWADNAVTGGATDTGWHVIVGIFDGGSSKIYVDGALVASTGGGGGLTIGNGLRIGGNATFDSYHNGKVATVGLYAGAMGATDVAYLSAGWYDVFIVPGPIIVGQATSSNTAQPITPVKTGSIGFDAAVGADWSGSGATVTVALTVADEDDRVLTVGSAAEVNGAPVMAISGVTYDGVALSFIREDHIDEGNSFRTELWYLDAPHTGTHDAVVTYGAGTLIGASVYALSRYGVAQGGPEAVGGNSSATDAQSFSDSITTESPDADVVDVIGGGSAQAFTASTSGGQASHPTPRTLSSQASGMSTKPVASPGSTAMAWTTPANQARYAHTIAAWAPVSAQTIVIAQASESDTAQAFTPLHSIVVRVVLDDLSVVAGRFLSVRSDLSVA